MTTASFFPNSSAIESVIIKQPEFIKIVFRSSDKVYTYGYNHEVAEQVWNCSESDASFGRLISTNLRNGNLVPSKA